MFLILGAGLSGLSASFHLGHENCLVLEASDHAYGHAACSRRNGFTWDEGPHVSFTKHEYVRDLFVSSVQGEFDEYPAHIGNYYRGHWIDHPAQVSLHQVPQPLRDECLASFIREREVNPVPHIGNYQQWIDHAFGPVFSKIFAGPYTRKYWTREPAEMTLDWIGHRIHFPSLQEVIAGSQGQVGDRHYFSTVRYPRAGGFQSFARRLWSGCKIRYGASIRHIDLQRREVHLGSGETLEYRRLVNTLPLPIFIDLCRNVPTTIREAATALSCSQLLLVNVAAPHRSVRPEHWIYVYDEDKLASRVNFTEKLTAGNAPPGWTGIQAEVYVGGCRPSPAHELAAEQVVDELIEMELLDEGSVERGQIDVHHRFCRWANVIFDHQTKPALAEIFDWMARQGLAREPDDLHPLTEWKESATSVDRDASIFLAGRFGQWKYYWSDDCVLRGRQLARQLGSAW